MSISSQLVTWAFANPILLAFCLFGALLAIFVVGLVSKLKPGPNPFAEDCARPPAPMVADSSARDKVIKQGKFRSLLISLIWRWPFVCGFRLS